MNNKLQAKFYAKAKAHVNSSKSIRGALLSIKKSRIKVLTNKRKIGKYAFI